MCLNESTQWKDVVTADHTEDRNGKPGVLTGPQRNAFRGNRRVQVVVSAAPLVQDTAEEVADFPKCVNIVSSAFSVLALCAKLADVGMEVKHGADA